MPERPHKSEKRFSRDKAAAKVGHPQPVVAAGGSQDGMNRYSSLRFSRFSGYLLRNASMEGRGDKRYFGLFGMHRRKISRTSDWSNRRSAASATGTPENIWACTVAMTSRNAWKT